MKPVDTAILSGIPDKDSDPTIYLNELLRTNKPEQQKNTFSFPTLENSSKTEDHTLIQTRIIRDLRELGEKQKLNVKKLKKKR